MRRPSATRSAQHRGLAERVAFRTLDDEEYKAFGKEELSEQQQLLLKEKRAEAERKAGAGPAPGATAANDAEVSDYPASATLCNKCHTKAVVIMDNCATCLSCGYSKCG